MDVSIAAARKRWEETLVKAAREEEIAAPLKASPAFKAALFTRKLEK